MGLQEKKKWVGSLFKAVEDCNRDDIKKYSELLKEKLLDPNSVTNENNQTILGFACSIPSPQKENVDLIDFLIEESGISVSSPQAGPNASTALMCAIISDTKGDHKPFVDKLFNYENLSKRDRHFALVYYSGIGDLEKVECCLSRYQCDVNFNHRNLSNALSRSVVSGQYSIVKKLLALPNIKVDTTNLYGETLLIEAIENRHVEIAQLLLDEKGEDLDIYAQSPFLGTPLTAAIFYQQNHLICRLLEEEESFDDKEHPGALLCAIRNDDVKTIKTLLRKGADINVTGQEGYETPDNDQILYENRASPFFTPPNGSSVFDLPIIVAIKERKLKALKAILKFNPELTKKGELGESAEMLMQRADISKDVKNILEEYLAPKLQLPKTYPFWHSYLSQNSIAARKTFVPSIKEELEVLPYDYHSERGLHDLPMSLSILIETYDKFKNHSAMEHVFAKEGLTAEERQLFNCVHVERRGQEEWLVLAEQAGSMDDWIKALDLLVKAKPGLLELSERVWRYYDTTAEFVKQLQGREVINTGWIQQLVKELEQVKQIQSQIKLIRIGCALAVGNHSLAESLWSLSSDDLVSMEKRAEARLFGAEAYGESAKALAVTCLIPSGLKSEKYILGAFKASIESAERSREQFRAAHQKKGDFTGGWSVKEAEAKAVGEAVFFACQNPPAEAEETSTSTKSVLNIPGVTVKSAINKIIICSKELGDYRSAVEEYLDFCREELPDEVATISEAGDNITVAFKKGATEQFKQFQLDLQGHCDEKEVMPGKSITSVQEYFWLSSAAYADVVSKEGEEVVLREGKARDSLGLGGEAYQALKAEGWVLVHSAKGAMGYRGHVFYHEGRNELCVAHRGSKNMGSFATDLRDVILNQKTGHSIDAVKETLLSRTCLDNALGHKNVQHYLGMQGLTLSTTGHSLGGWLAALFQFVVSNRGGLYFSGPVIGRGFDAPGIKDFLKSLQSHDKNQRTPLESLNYVNYVVQPDIVNTCNEQFGRVICLEGGLLNEANNPILEMKDIASIHGRGHIQAAILAGNYSYMHRWPKTSSDTLNKLAVAVQNGKWGLLGLGAGLVVGASSKLANYLYSWFVKSTEVQSYEEQQIIAAGEAFVLSIKEGLEVLPYDYHSERGLRDLPMSLGILIETYDRFKNHSAIEHIFAKEGLTAEERQLFNRVQVERRGQENWLVLEQQAESIDDWLEALASLVKVKPGLLELSERVWRYYDTTAEFVKQLQGREVINTGWIQQLVKELEQVKQIQSQTKLIRIGCALAVGNRSLAESLWSLSVDDLVSMEQRAEERLQGQGIGTNLFGAEAYGESAKALAVTNLISSGLKSEKYILGAFKACLESAEKSRERFRASHQGKGDFTGGRSVKEAEAQAVGEYLDFFGDGWSNEVATISEADGSITIAFKRGATEQFKQFLTELQAHCDEEVRQPSMGKPS